jgi:hypothetical protein
MGEETAVETEDGANSRADKEKKGSENIALGSGLRAGFIISCV